MKKQVILIGAIAFIFYSCDSSDTSENSSSNNSNDIESHEVENVESLIETKTEFVAFDGVSRYNNTEKLAFERYTFRDVFEFIFPIEPAFEIVEKSDHINHEISEVYKGTIYAIDIEDYTETPGEVDAGYGDYVHDSYLEFMEASSNYSESLDLGNEITGKYSNYSYQIEDKLYNVDQVTYRTGDYVIHFMVTSRPDFESADKVNEFIRAVKFL